VVPHHLGRARTSTVVLALLFVGLYTLYLYVRPPDPPVETVPVVGPAVQTAAPVVPTGTPGPTTPPQTPTPPPTAPAPTTVAPSATGAPGT